MKDRGRRRELTANESDSGAILLWVVVLGWPTQTAAFEGTDQGDGKRHFVFPNLEREYSIARNGESCPLQHLGTLGIQCWEYESEAWGESIRIVTTSLSVVQAKVEHYKRFKEDALVREVEEAEVN